MASEAYDDSPPRNGTIFFYALLTIFLLVCVKFLLDSYFFKMMDTEVEAKILTQGMDEVVAMRTAEQKESDAVKAAMSSLAQRGRNAMPEIKPTGMVAPAEQGWRELQQPTPGAAPAPADGAPGKLPTEAALPPGQEPPASPGVVPAGTVGQPAETGGEPKPAAEPANPPTSPESTTKSN
jgi:hypothetical protein